MAASYQAGCFTYRSSVLLDAGESTKVLSGYLGHHGPGFTFRTYTHLMPPSAARTQPAIDSLFGDGAANVDGPTTAQDDDTGFRLGITVVSGLQASSFTPSLTSKRMADCPGQNHGRVPTRRSTRFRAGRR